MKNKPVLEKLEPRLMFDGAAVDTTLDFFDGSDLLAYTPELPAEKPVIFVSQAAAEFDAAAVESMSDTFTVIAVAPGQDGRDQVNSVSFVSGPVFVAAIDAEYGLPTIETFESLEAFRLAYEQADADLDALADVDVAVKDVDPATQLVVIDASVSFQADILQTIPADWEVVLINGNSDGLEQLVSALQGRSDIQAIHLFTHGSDGQLLLGNGQLTTDTLTDAAQALGLIGQALTADGDILIYGCDVAETFVGQSFVDRLAALTGADIAASDDATGGVVEAGDWTLEYQSGDVATDAVFVEGYQDALANLPISTGSGTTSVSIDRYDSRLFYQASGTGVGAAYSQSGNPIWVDQFTENTSVPYWSYRWSSISFPAFRWGWTPWYTKTIWFKVPIINTTYFGAGTRYETQTFTLEFDSAYDINVDPTTIYKLNANGSISTITDDIGIGMNVAIYHGSNFNPTKPLENLVTATNGTSWIAQKDVFQGELKQGTYTVVVSFDGWEFWPDNNVWYSKFNNYAEQLWGNFDLQVTNLNRAPVWTTRDLSFALDGSGDQRGAIAWSLVGDATIFDPDSDAITLTAHWIDGGTESALPTWLTFNPNDLSFSGNPPENTGDLILRLKATDGQLTSSKDFTISFTNDNDQPVVAVAIVDQAHEGEGVWEYQVPAGTFTDADPGTDDFTYTATLADGSALPAWLSISEAGLLRGNPPAGASSLSIKVTVNDGSGQSNATQSTTFTLNLRNTNDIGIAADRTKTVDEDTTLSFTAADFVYNDADTHANNNTTAGTGKTPQSIRIVELPSAGTLWLDSNENGSQDDGEVIAQNQVIAYSDLSKVRYTPNADWASDTLADLTNDADDAFKWVATDGYNETVDPAIMTIEVNLVNDAPRITFTSGSSLSVRPNTGEALGSILVDSGLTIFDADAAYTTNPDFDRIKGINVSITDATNGQFVPNDTLAIDTTLATSKGITASYDSQLGVLTLVGDATSEEYQAVLRTLTFENNTTGNDNDHVRDISLTLRAVDIGTRNVVTLSGNGEYIDTQFAALPVLGDFTVSAWAQIASDVADGQYFILSQGNLYDNFFISLAKIDGNWRIRLGDNWYIDNTFPSDGQWHQYTVTRSGNVGTLYIDGVKIASGAMEATLPATSLRIGDVYRKSDATEWEGSNSWKGSLSDIRVYDRMLDQGEINASLDTAQTLHGYEANLVAYYPLANDYNNHAAKTSWDLGRDFDVMNGDGVDGQWALGVIEGDGSAAFNYGTFQAMTGDNSRVSVSDDSVWFDHPTQPYWNTEDGWGTFGFFTTLDPHWATTVVGTPQILPGYSNPAAIQFTAETAGVYTVDARFWDGHSGSAPTDPMYEVYKVDANGNATLVSKDNATIVDDNTGATKVRASVHQILLQAGAKLVFAVHKGSSDAVGSDEVAASIHINLVGAQVTRNGQNYIYNLETGHYLALSPQTVTSWGDAKTAAESATLDGVEGYLATPADDTSMTIMRALSAGANVYGAFVGLYQVDATENLNNDLAAGWVWGSGPKEGSPFDGAWNPGEPNSLDEDYGTFWWLNTDTPYNGAQYNDGSYSGELRYFTEFGETSLGLPSELTARIKIDQGSTLVFVDAVTVYSSKTGHYYKLDGSTGTFTDAQTISEASTYNDGVTDAGGYLARLEDADELAIITKLTQLNNVNGVWVGAKQVTNPDGTLDWKWVDSSGNISDYTPTSAQQIETATALESAGWRRVSYDDFSHGNTGWRFTASNNLVQINGEKLMNRYDSSVDANQPLAKSFDINQNETIITFDFIRNDSWDNERFLFDLYSGTLSATGYRVIDQSFVANSQLTTPMSGSVGTPVGDISYTITPVDDYRNFFGNLWADQTFRVQITVPEGFSDLITVRMDSSLGSAATDEGYAIDNFVLWQKHDAIAVDGFDNGMSGWTNGINNSWLSGNRTYISNPEFGEVMWFSGTIPTKNFVINNDATTVEFDLLKLGSWDDTNQYGYDGVGTRINDQQVFFFKIPYGVSKLTQTITGSTVINGKVVEYTIVPNDDFGNWSDPTGATDQSFHVTLKLPDDFGHDIKLAFEGSFTEASSNESAGIDNLSVYKTNPTTLISVDDFENGDRAGWDRGDNSTATFGSTVNIAGWGDALWFSAYDPQKIFFIDNKATRIEFDFLALDSWDNEFLRVRLNDLIALDAYRSFGINHTQTVQGSVNIAGKTVTYQITPNDDYGNWTASTGSVANTYKDQSFHIVIDLPADFGDSVKLSFETNLNETGNYESAAIDNVRVYSVENAAYLDANGVLQTAIADQRDDLGGQSFDGFPQKLHEFETTAYIANDGLSHADSYWDRVMGFATDGNYIYTYYSEYDSNNAPSRIAVHNLDGTPHTSVNFGTTGTYPLGYAYTEMTFVEVNGAGYLYLRDPQGTADGANDKLWRISTNDLLNGISNPVEVTNRPTFLKGDGWLYGNLFSLPDGRLGTVGNFDDARNKATVQLFALSNNGLTLTLDQEITIFDPTGWLDTSPLDSHGFGSDGKYLYILDGVAGNYKAFDLVTGHVAYDGSSKALTGRGIDNALYLSRDPITGDFLWVDHAGSHFARSVFTDYDVDFANTENAFELNGKTDYVDLGTIDGLGSGDGAYTLEAMVKADGAAMWSRIFDLGNGNQNNNIWLGFRGDTGQIVLEQYNGVGGLATATAATRSTLPLGEWVHITAVYDGNGGVTIYFNGVAQQLEILAAFENPTDISRSKSFVGRSNWVADQYFDGSITEVRIWKDARTQQEIVDNMTGVLSDADRADSNLIGYWNGSETGAHGELTDLSGNNKTAYKAGDYVRMDQFEDIVLRFASGTSYSDSTWDINGLATDGTRLFIYYANDSGTIIEHDMNGNRLGGSGDHLRIDPNGLLGGVESEMVYANGYLYFRNSKDTDGASDDKIYRFSLDDNTIQEVALPSTNGLLAGTFHFAGSLFSMPDGRLGTLSTADNKVRIFSLSEDGLSLSFSEDIVINENWGWLNNFHGATSDGRYLYVLRMYSSTEYDYRIYDLATGNVALNGTPYNLYQQGVDNASYMATDPLTGDIFWADYLGSSVARATNFNSVERTFVTEYGATGTQLAAPFLTTTTSVLPDKYVSDTRQVVVRVGNTAATLSDWAISLNEDATYAFDKATFDANFADPELDSLYSITITALPDPATGSLLLDGQAVSQNDIIMAGDIAKLTFAAAENYNGAATFSYRGSDGYLNTTNDATVSITINALNDAPVLDTTADPALTAIDEDSVDADTAGTRVADMLVANSITDPDGAAATAIAVTWIDNTNGVWQYKLTGGAWANISNVTNQKISLADAALLLDANAALRFVPDTHYNGTSTFKFRAWDQTSGDVGGTFDSQQLGGNTILSAAEDTATLTINPVNDAPSSRDVTITMDEDTVREFTAADFSFNDFDIGDTLVSVKILSVPNAGTLALDGTEVSADTIVSESDLAAGRLTFTPQANAFGDAYATFTFAVNDGEALSEPKSVTIHVIDTNDAPTAMSWLTGGHVAEDALATTVVGRLQAVDPNTGDTLRFERVANTNFVVGLDGTVTVAAGARLDYETATSQTLTVKVTDGGGLSYEQDVTIQIDDVVEQGPSLVTRSFYIAKGQSHVVTATELDGSDAQTDDAGLTYTVTANPAGGTFFIDVNDDNVADESEILGVYSEATPNARDTFSQQDVINGKLKFIKDGTQTSGRLTVSLSDGDDQTDDVEGTLMALVSSPPVVASEINDQEWNITGAQSFVVPSSTFDDPDFDVLTLSATLDDGAPLPSWLSFDPATGTFSGNPADGSVIDGASLTIRVTASDGRNTPVSDDFELNFSATPTKPQVAHPLDDVTFDGAGAKTFTVPADTFSDPNGDAFTYDATIPAGISGWLTFDPATRSFSGNPPATAVPGPYTISVSATANGDAVSSTFKLWVLNANDMPTGNAISDWTITGADEVTKDVNVNNFTDGDVGDTLTLSAYLIDGSGNDAELPSWITFAYDAATGVGQFIAKAPSGGGTLTVRVYASDAYGGQGYEDFTVTYSGGVNEGPSVMTSEGISSTNQRGELQLETLQKLELFSVSQGDTATITKDFLRETDRDDDAEGITFTLTSTPKYGQLWLDADGDGTLSGSEATLSIGSTFTQADIDNGLLKYKHTAGDDVDDSFTFNVADGGEDNALPVEGVSFDIQVTPKPAAPTLLSVLRTAPTTEVTNADELTFKVIFSEGMRGVDASDFALKGELAGSAAIKSVTIINSKTYSVTVGGDGIANASGTLGLRLASDADMLDTATRTNNVDLTSVDATEQSETYTLENTAPVPTLTASTRWHDGATAFYVYLDFNEAVNDLTLADLSATNATLSNLERISTDPNIDPDTETRDSDPLNPPSPQGNRYRVLVTPSFADQHSFVTNGNDDIVVTLASGSVFDKAGNANASAVTVDVIFPDTTAIDVNSDDGWMAILTGANFDPNDDTQAKSDGIDLVGNADHPLLYTKYNDFTEEVAFRIRMESANEKSGTFHLLGIADTTVQTPSINFFIGVFVSSNGREVSVKLYETGNGENTSPSTTSFNVKTAVSPSGTAVDIKAIANSDLDSNGKNDGFVSFKLDINDLVTFANGAGGFSGYTINTSVGMVLLTATQTNSINGDIGGVDGNADVPFNFTPIVLSNALPTALDVTRNVNEDSSYTVLPTDFGFDDPNQADTLTSVVVVSLPTQGDLVLGADYVVVGQTISFADINSGNLRYVPSANYSGSDSWQFQVSDGKGLSAAAYSFDMTVVPVNDAPVIANLDGDVAYWSTNNSAVIIDPFNQIFVTDIDSVNFNTGQVNVEVTAGKANENQLSVASGGDITVTGSDVSYQGTVIGTIDTNFDGHYNAVTNAASKLRITLNADATPENVSVLLQALRYTYVGNDAISVIREIDVQVSDDGGALSNVATVTMVGPPIYQYDEVYPTYAYEDTVLPFAAEDFGIASGDTIKITFIGSARGSFVNGNGTALTVGDTLTYAEFNAITFVPDLNDNGDGINSLCFKFTGAANSTGFDANGLSLIEPTIIINLAPVNDAPTVDLNGTNSGTDHAVTWTEAQGLATADTTVSLIPNRVTSLADVDDTTFANLIVSSNVAAGDRLMVGTTALDMTQNGDATLTIAGNDFKVVINSDGTTARVVFTHVTNDPEHTVAAYESLLDSLGFNSLSENPDTTKRTFSISVNDGTIDSNVAKTVVSLTAVNDKTVVNNASNTVQYDWGLDIPVTLMPAVTLQDYDGTVSSVTLSIPDGYSGDQLNFTNTGAVTGVWNAATRTLTLTNTGSTLAMQSALRSVTFSTSLNTNGVAYVDMVATDNDGLSTLSATTTIKLVNNSPRIDLIDASDTFGASDKDNITSEITPTFDIKVPDNAQDGDTLTISDADGNTLGSISVDAADAGTTVQFTIAQGDALADGAYTLTVELASTKATAEISIVIDTMSPTMSGETFSYAENQSAGVTLGSLSAGDQNGITSYAITAGNDNGYFAIDANGNISLTDAGAANNVASNDFETDENTFDLTVRATDVAGNTVDVTITLNVTNRDELTPTINAQELNYHENQANGSLVGQVSASDDIGVVGYAFKHADSTYHSTSEDGYFSIDASGKVTLILAGTTGEANDYESGDNQFVHTVRVSDASGKTTEAAITLNVVDVNDIPYVIRGNDHQADFAEGGSAVVLAPTITVGDQDDVTLASATVTITSGYKNGSDTLDFANNGINMGEIEASFDPDTGTLTLTSSGAAPTLVQWQNALRAVTFINDSNQPGDSRTIAWQVNDGTDNSNIAITTVIIEQKYTEQEAAFRAVADVDFSGLDQKTFASSGTLTIALDAPTATEVLALTTASTASSVAGQISVVGTDVYLGDGTSATVIATLSGGDYSVNLSNHLVITANSDFPADETVMENIATLVTYYNSGDLSAANAEQSVALTLTAVADDATTVSVAKTISVIEVNDDVSLAQPASITYEDTSAADTFNAESGTLVGSDPDSGTTYTYGLPDGVAVSATSVSESGTYGVLTLNTSTGAYTFTPNADEINALAAPDSEDFTVTVSDGSGSTASRTLTVSITVAENEAPVISVDTGDADTAALQEDGTTAITASGTLSVTDIDLTDTVSVSSVSVSASGTTSGITDATFLSMLTVDAGNVIDANNTTGDITWNFNSNGADLAYLGDTQSLVLTYKIKVTDSATNESSLQDLIITIDGASAVPFITAGDDVASLLETNAALIASGSVIVTDPDVADTVNITSALAVSGTSDRADSRAPTDAELLAMLSLDPTNVTNSSAGTTINWSFDSDVETFDYLAKGETLVLTYTLTATDDSADQHSDTTTVTIKIIGTNDAPVISGGAATSDKTETDAALIDTGSFTVDDLDTTDVVNASVALSSSTTGTSSNTDPAKPSDAELLAMLSVTPTTILDGTTTNATLSWSFNSGNEAFDYLADGETLVLVYTVTVTDDDATALSDSETITVTITGSNDAPILSISRASVTYTDTVANDTFVATNGLLSSVDADTSDTATFGIAFADATAVTLAGFDVSKTVTYGTLFVNSTSGAYRFVPNNDAINGLKADTSYAFDVSVTDGTVTRFKPFTVNLVAANDTPVVSGTFSGEVIEGNIGDTTTVSGALNITDRDADDTPSFADVSVTPGSNNFGDFVLVSNTWTYTLDQSAVQGLDAGDSVTDTITFTATDGTAQQVVVTIQGTNDAPTLTALTTIEYIDHDGDDTFNVVSDILDPDDVDSDDTASFAIFGQQSDDTRDGFDVSKAGAFGVLYLNTNTGAYDFVPNDAALEAASMTVSETFTLRVIDSQGASASETLTVSVVGVNDSTIVTTAPQRARSADPTSLVETNTALTTAGAFTVSDPDINQTVTAQLHAVSRTLNGGSADAIANTAPEWSWLTLASNLVLNSSEDSARLTWDFDSDVETFDDLRAGDTLLLTYTVRFDDGSSVVDADIVLTINGTNDGPQITVETDDAAAAAIAETNEVSRIASGTLSVSDLESGDTLTANVAGVVMSGTAPVAARPSESAALAMFTITPTTLLDDATATSDLGGLGWSFDSGASEAFDQLADGETLVLTYTVRVADDAPGASGIDTQSVTITITGSNDAPVISYAADTDAKPITGDDGLADAIQGFIASGDVTKMSDTGTLSFVDVDL
ncbi:DUF4347 domain-containing protein, partial [Rhodobacteraceae bacterium]|nr:DUF4347 domain-containing protein [Paracoccaceae bacterium]